MKPVIDGQIEFSRTWVPRPAHSLFFLAQFCRRPLLLSVKDPETVASVACTEAPASEPREIRETPRSHARSRQFLDDSTTPETICDSEQVFCKDTNRRTTAQLARSSQTSFFYIEQQTTTALASLASCFPFSASISWRFSKRKIELME